MLWSACQGFSPDNGSQLCVIATRIAYRAGDVEMARSFAADTLARIESALVRERMAALLEDISPGLSG
jgi:hypothetical protein